MCVSKILVDLEKTKSKQSRLEKTFSQVENQSSQETTHTANTPSTVVEVHSSQEVTPTENPTEEALPNGTVYFSNGPYSQNASYFQDFSAFQQQNFQTSFQQPFQYPHFPNEHLNNEHVIQAVQKQDFPQVFRGPGCVE